MLLKRVVVVSYSDVTYVRFKKIILRVPSIEVLGILTEPFEKIYKISDFRKKKVLDVGGFLGETACLFHSWGAQHVVVYESNWLFAKYAKVNLRINKISGLVHNALVDGKNHCNSVNWLDVLMEGFDIVKVDCEGCEQYLLDVPNDILKKTPYWVIECHNAKIFMDLASKFSSAGFDIRYRFYYWSVLYQLVGRLRLVEDDLELPKTIPLIIMYAVYSLDR